MSVPVAEGEPYQAQVTTSGGDLNSGRLHPHREDIQQRQQRTIFLCRTAATAGGRSPQESCYVRNKI